MISAASALELTSQSYTTCACVTSESSNDFGRVFARVTMDNFHDHH